MPSNYIKSKSCFRFIIFNSIMWTIFYDIITIFASRNGGTDTSEKRNQKRSSRSSNWLISRYVISIIWNLKLNYKLIIQKIIIIDTFNLDCFLRKENFHWQSFILFAIILLYLLRTGFYLIFSRVELTLGKSEVAGDRKLFVANLFNEWMYVCANWIERALCLRYPVWEKSWVYY